MSGNEVITLMGEDRDKISVLQEDFAFLKIIIRVFF